MKDMEKGDFNYAFISSKYAMECIRVWSKRSSLLHLIVMVELGEASVFKNTGSILIPVYSLSLANVLNGVPSAGGGHPLAREIHFSAPDARILIVDDIATNLRVAAELMAPYNMTIDTCLSGSEAVALAKKNRYDVIVMDHMMPGMDGVEAAMLIRNLEADDDYYRNLPIIALTANALSGQREMLLKNGIDDFLAKPIEMQKLHEIMEKWIPREKQAEPCGVPADSDMMKCPEIEGIDTEAGLTRIGGSVAAYLRILTVFYRDANERIKQIKDAAASADIPLYTTLVHALKSASRNIGALDVGDLAEELEIAGDNRDTAAIRAKTQTLLEKLRSLTKNISAALIRNTADTREETDLPSLRLEGLKDALLHMDIEAVNKLISDYMSMSLTPKAKELITDINQDILLFEYDKAVERINLVL
jgi:CheY-like chemotaxis protein